MTYGTLPRETLAELLLYLAEHEHFPSLKGFGSVSERQLKVALGALAEELKSSEALPADFNLDQFLRELKAPAQAVFKQLSPSEQARLLRGFIGGV